MATWTHSTFCQLQGQEDKLARLVVLISKLNYSRLAATLQHRQAQQRMPAGTCTEQVTLVSLLLVMIRLPLDDGPSTIQLFYKHDVSNLMI